MTRFMYKGGKGGKTPNGRSTKTKVKFSIDENDNSDNDKQNINY